MRLLRKGLEFIFQAERNLFIYVEGFKKCVIHLSCLTKGLEEEHTIQTTNKSEKTLILGKMKRQMKRLSMKLAAYIVKFNMIEYLKM